MRSLGYRYRDKLIWGKLTSLHNLVNGNGNILRKSHEALAIFSKGNVDSDLVLHKAKGMILEELVRSSEKPEVAIDEIMVAISDKHYLQIFARDNNMRTNMVCVGNQLTLPEMKDEANND